MLVNHSIARSLASHLDLNDLHALSRTCRQFRANLIQYSAQLSSHSLRCTLDAQPLLADILALYHAAPDGDFSLDLSIAPDDVRRAILDALPENAPVQLPDPAAAGSYPRLLLSTKIGKCARDLVGECRKCGTIVCRNCAAKAPSDRCLKDRFRRLCSACLEAPLDAHTAPLVQRKKSETECIAFDSSMSLGGPTRSMGSWSDTSTPYSSHSSSHDQLAGTAGEPPSTTKTMPTTIDSVPSFFTASAFTRDPCTCATRGAFLCGPCGQNLRAADTTYKRVWTWRSRYSTHIGGLGTGMGEGDQGQKCGRGAGCLDPTGEGIAWVEIDCSDQVSPQTSRPGSVRGLVMVGGGGDDEQQQQQQEQSLGGDVMASAEHRDRERERSGGYLQQEIEGIGGVVKKKIRKRIRVGATVWEFDDERESGRYLEREASGRCRSWCGWCGRVAEGEKDREK